ncbi:MAG: polysaccharide biosynthesis C-terminal domain-containing protein, partial [Clostridia bacterium]|nr:polysaccharide biosynthesis C-terminal domain-containing protein [Clostridia bacterium]
ALPVSASAILGNLISSAVTLTLPARLALAGLGESEALSDIGRINAMAAPFMSLPLTVVHPVGAAVTPRITGSLARGERKDAERKGARNLETAGLVAVPLSLLLVPVGPYLVENLFGVKVGERTLVLLAAGTVFASYQAAASAVLMGYGRHRFAMLSGLAGGAVHFLLMWRLSTDPAFGVEGQVIGIAAGALVSALLNGGMLLFGLKIRLPSGRTFLRPFLIAIPAALCEKTAFRLLGGRLAGTVAGIAAGAAVTALLMRIYGYRVRAYLGTLVPGAQNAAGSKSFRTPPESAEEAAAAAAFTASFRREASPGRRDAGSSAERESRKRRRERRRSLSGVEGASE